MGSRRAIQQEQITRLAAQLPLPQIQLPFVNEEIGPDAIETLADAFAAQVTAMRAPS